jgi:translocation and assembly module TamB
MQNNEFKLYNQLTLLNATYKAYGQDLTIDKGQLLFAGDVRNTGVNITASRKASDWNDKTIAYLNLTGMLTKPTSSVYTKPALNESDALAYLLTGGPLGKSTSSHAGILAKAALGLGGDYIDTIIGNGVRHFITDMPSKQVGACAQRAMWRFSLGNCFLRTAKLVW